MNTYWISLPCDLLSSPASFQCSLLHHLHLSSDLGLSKYVNQHSHLNLSRNVRLSVLYDLDFNTYHSMFKQDPPKNMRTPLDKNDHPELDDTELLTGESIQHYLTMVGQLQWLVTLGRFDIHAQVTTMSRFRSAPRKGHLERLQRIYGYVLKTKHYSTRYRTEEPDYSYLPNMKYDWSYTVYGNVQEIIPNNCPKPLGNLSLPQPPLMQISFTALQLVHHSLHASISATILLLIGTPRSKQQ